MSIKGLVDPDCGGPNPLMQLATKVHASNVQQKELGFQPQLEDDDQQHIPHTFDMQSLLNGFNNIELMPGTADTANSWEHEYLATKQTPVNKGSVEMNNPTFFDYSKHVTPKYTTSMTSFPQQFHLPPNFLAPQLIQNSTKWEHEYVNDTETSSSQKTAHEILDLFEAQEEIKRNEEDMKDRLSKEWVNEYQKQNKEGEDFSDIHEHMAREIENDVEYWQKLQNDWTNLFSENQFQNEEEAELNGYEKQYNVEYDFEKNNPFNNCSGAFEKGLKKLDEGDLISAILLFEEAVQADPTHVEAWQYLGTSQAENEQEVLAIRALNKCIELQPDNLVARMNLAVSYTNEYLHTEAYKALKSWIQHSPSYSHLIGIPVSNVKTKLGTSFLSNEMFEELKNLFLAAARIAPQGNIDADVQVGLGVIFNLSGDYEKAVDCFNAAIQARPDSAYLWNKLGATLANGSRSAEAIPAYRNALKLRPGFIRCRYNLGISCVNMKSYPEAIQHFLSALNMQRKGEDPSRPVSTMSENIWSTLRMTISLLGRLDLMKSVDKRDLQLLNNEFQMDLR